MNCMIIGQLKRMPIVFVPKLMEVISVSVKDSQIKTAAYTFLGAKDIADVVGTNSATGACKQTSFCFYCQKF